MSESNHHYKIHKPEPLELIQRYNLSFIEGNVVKYVMRSPFKGDSTGDLEKALSYAQLLQDIGFYRQFEASDLDQYTELTELEKEIVCDVLRADVTCTVQKLQKAIGIRGMDDVKKALGKRFAGEKESIYLECPSCKDTLLGNVETQGLTTTITFEAVEETEKHKQHKPFDPDWLPPHPLNTFFDWIDEDSANFQKLLEKGSESYLEYTKNTKNTKNRKNGKIRRFNTYGALIDFIKGSNELIEALADIPCSTKSFWKNRYDHYWEKRKQ